MSNNINNSSLPKREENKNEFSQNIETEKLFLQDVKLLTSLKSIPGKIIPLSNQINDVPKFNNNENSNNNINKTETNIKFYQKSKSIFTPFEKSNINGINLINNNIINNVNKYTTNNYFFNNGINNLSINLNPFNNQIGGMPPFPDYGGFLENPLIYSPSNHPSFLSIKSDMKNNFIWTDNKFTQNSFYFPNIIVFNGNYNNQIENNLNKGNYNNILTNKFSHLSFQQNNNNILNNEDLLKKKRTTNLLIKKKSEYNSDNINNNNYTKNNSDEKISQLNFNNNYEISKNEIIKDNIKEKDDNKKNKKILFNIENYFEESYEEYNNNYPKIKNNKIIKNNLFNCYQKKKKRRKKNEIKKYKCVHPNCEYSYKTLKQLQNHHYKMISECQLDSVQILKLIYKTKLMLINLIKDNKKKKEFFAKLYEQNINNISLSNYSEFITGSHFDDIV